MKPYYADESVTLYHGDCREVTEWLIGDVLVCDPPYGMAYVSRTGVEVTGDESTAVRDAALAMWAPRPALVFGTWRVTRPQDTKQVLIWDKTEGNGTGGSASPWFLSHEEVYVLGNWPPVIPGGRAREGGSPSRSSGVLRLANYNSQSDSRPQHPTPKPLPLMHTLLSKCPAGVVADPFAGSGSTLLAARILGRRSIGVEVDERYCELAAARLSQGDLFGDAA